MVFQIKALQPFNRRLLGHCRLTQQQRLSQHGILCSSPEKQQKNYKTNAR